MNRFYKVFFFNKKHYLIFIYLINKGQPFIQSPRRKPENIPA